MLIGLTGKNGSGKGEVAKFLQERGFQYRSLSDEIRAEVRKRKKPITRANLVATGNELRSKFGPGVLAERLIRHLEGDRHYVIDSIRHPAEVAALKRLTGFVLVEVHADQKIRFERIKSRARENDPTTFKEFVKLEAKEGRSKIGSDQQLNKTIALADFKVMSSGTIPELHKSVTDVMMKVAKSIKRPGWDEYFMGIAKVVSLRSNCVKRKVAAVVVKDKRVISTGYNGTPRGVKNCNEGGCPRCNSFSTSGTKLEECLCSHGEENAITQSAYHGVNIGGATIYTTFSPCLLCTKMIINSGLSEVVYNVDYPLAGTALRLLREAKIKVRRLKV